MPSKEKEEVLKVVRDRIPERATILFLSLTGSRAFGWGSTNQDYDVHGVVACENYWDWMHIGISKFDTNIYELQHVMFDIDRQHFEIFQNFSNAFYKDDRFDYDGMLGFCTLTGIKYMDGDIQSQIHRWKYDRAARTALHSYRILMVPLNFIETRKFELDIFKLNEKYNLTQLENLREEYITHRVRSNIDKIQEELDGLHDMYKEKMSTVKIDTPDMVKATKWLIDMKRIFYGNKEVK